LVKISTTETRSPGMLWVIEVTNEEIEEKHCKTCGKPFIEEERVYYCEVCKNIYHESCLMDLMRRNKQPCYHTMKEQFQYFCGIVKII